MDTFKNDSDYYSFVTLFMDKAEDGYIWRNHLGEWVKEKHLTSSYIKEIIKECKKYGTTFTKLLLVGMFKEILHRRRKKLQNKKRRNECKTTKN